MKRLISIFLVLVLILGLTACKNKKGKENSSSGSDITSSDTDSIISDLKDSLEDGSDNFDSSDDSDNKGSDGTSDYNDGDFDNTSGTDAETPTPGEDEFTDSTDDSINFGESLLDKETALFYYEGKGYFYGINENNVEVMGFIADDGRLIDTFQGAGHYSVSDGSKMFEYAGIESFERSLVDGEMSVTVKYLLNGISADNTVIKTNYVFHLNSITVTSDLDTKSVASKVKSATFDKLFLNSPVKNEKDLDYEWVYPENGDYPYQNFKSTYLKHWFDDTHVVYIFNRDINQDTMPYVKGIPEDYIPITASNEKGFSYNLIYDMVFEDTKKTENVHYEARFKGMDSQFAVGIAPVKKNDDDSTVFVADEVDLNINVTNLIDYDLNFSLRYDVRDYYGNIVDAGIYKNSTVFTNNEANRNIKIKGKYGMYWLNLYVVSPLSTYYECYPFMLVDKYSFKYMNESPFGIDADHAYTHAELNTNLSVVDKLGIYRIRPGSLPDGAKDIDRYKLLEKYGLRCVLQADGNLTSKASLNTLLKNWNNTKRYADWVIMNNELDGEAKGNEQMCLDLVRDVLVPKTANQLAVSFIKEKNIPISFMSSCHGNYELQSALYKYGVWQNATVIDTHYYCSPKIPDKYQITYNQMYSVEYGLERMERAFANFGGLKEKRYVVGETGYHTIPDSLTGTCIRTQGDFNTRIALLCLMHDVDNIFYYSLLDRTSYYKGSSTEWMEMNFGAFSCYDYYGVLKPKPWAAAYATLTRQLDGVTDVKANEKYDTDGEGTVRAFNVKSKLYDNMIVAWTNIFMLPNSNSQGVSSGLLRSPNLPWENQWEASEKVTFDAADDVVTVVDTMGNSKKYKAKGGKVTIPLTGSPVYIHGVK